MSHRSHHREDHADDEDDDADGPQDRDIEEKTGDEENDSENDHGYLPDSLLVGVTISGSVLEDVFGFGPCLLDVSLGLLDASLGAQPGVAGGAAEVLLGGALNGFGLMGELLFCRRSCGIPFVDDDHGDASDSGAHLPVHS